MFIAEVIGTVVSARKSPNVDGLPMRVVRRVTTEARPTDSYTVAVDVVGASEGELVLITSGSAARNSHLTDMRPVDAIIMAIVDTWQVDNRVKYAKG